MKVDWIDSFIFILESDKKMFFSIFLYIEYNQIKIISLQLIILFLKVCMKI